MDKTFIKTSKGIIHLEHVTFIEPGTGSEGLAIRIDLCHMVLAKRVCLQGAEAEAFLQLLPIAFDLSNLAKGEKDGVEVRT